MINAYLADKEVFRFKMTTEHFGCFARYGLDFNTDLLTFSGWFHGFMIIFYASHHAQINKLKQ